MQTSHDKDTYTKHASGGTNLLNEALALMWLAEAEGEGGIHIARVESATNNTLVEEKIHAAPTTPQAAEAMGRALAHTHAAGASWFGQPPQPLKNAQSPQLFSASSGAPSPDATPNGPSPDTTSFTPSFQGEGYIIDHTLTRVIPRQEDAPSSWGAYFAQTRIAPFVDVLYKRNIFSPEDMALFQNLCKRLRTGDFDSEQPALVKIKIENDELEDSSVTCARLHGDLWAGNILYDANPSNPSRGALIDPMAHGGHAEADLAMLHLFGFSYLDRLMSAYNEVSPLADGWRERIALHQLAPLLHHCILFGASYVPQTLQACRQYV